MNKKMHLKCAAAIIVSALTMASFAGCTADGSQNKAESSAASQTENSSHTENDENKKDKDEEFASGEAILSLQLENGKAEIVASENNDNADEEFYSGKFIIRVGANTEHLTSPTASNAGIKLNKKEVQKHFLTDCVEVNEKKYDCVAFLSETTDKKFCTVYTVNSEGVIAMVDSVEYSGEISLDSGKILIDDAEKYTIDAENNKLSQN